MRDLCNDRIDAQHAISSRNSGVALAPTFLNAFTVDVEDYFQVTAFEREVERGKWDSYPSRVENNTRRLLDQLAEYDVRGTFFVVGWIADRYPQLVADIRHAGHEVGSHSYWHRQVYRLTPAEFRQDLIRSRNILEDILGESIHVFRAPSFSITANSLWAMEVLVEEGFTIDSSVFPVYHDRYGIPGANPAIHRWQTRSGTLWECPPSVVSFAGLNLPVSGGGYFRLYPGWLSVRLLRQVNEFENRSFVFYIHPWEIDPRQPRLKVGSTLSRWRHYVNLAATEQKLRRLWRQFRFETLSNVVKRVDREGGPVASDRRIRSTAVQRPA